MGFFVGNKNKFITLLVCLFAVAMVCFPQVTEAGSKSAIIIWANSIVPVLLPFFIFSDFIKRTGNLEKLPPRVYPFLVAFLSGYPMGAKVTADLVRSHNLSPAAARHILSYSLVTGPAFLMGTIGGFIGNREAAFVVLAAHYTGALLNGLLWQETGAKYIRPVSRSITYDSRQGKLMEHFSASILAGFKAMAVILAYLMFFMIGMHLLDRTKLLELVGSETAVSFLKGLLEMTAGCSMIGACNISVEMKTALASVLVSFGGLSVIGQSASMAAGSGIGTVDIIMRKGTHGLISGILAVILVQFMI